MPTYGPYGYGNYPYMQQNYQGGVQPNLYSGIPQAQNIQTNQYAFVNGIEGAKAFQVPVNQTMLLMDNDSPMLYLKTSNGMGQSSLRYFKLIEVSESDLKTSVRPQIEFASKEDLQSLSKKLENLQKQFESLKSKKVD